jgi:protein-disulfide isomerase
MKKVLAAVKKHTGFAVTAAQVNDKKVSAALKTDEDAAGKMMVSGTPTVYIDGEWDKIRDGYKKLIK